MAKSHVLSDYGRRDTNAGGTDHVLYPNGGIGDKMYNGAGAGVVQGTLLHVNGYNATAAKRAFTRADANAQLPATHVALETIASTGNGSVAVRAETDGHDTSLATIGDPVYLSSTVGGWTLTDPSLADPSVYGQRVGQVTRVSATTGAILWDLPGYYTNIPATVIGTADPGTVWVDGNRTDSYTADGTFARPYKTIATGVAALSAARSTLVIRGGDYTQAAAVAITTYNGVRCHIIGLGRVTITGPAAAAIFTWTGGAGAAGHYLHFENLVLTPNAGQSAITYDNTGATNAATLVLKGCHVTAGITVTGAHSTAGQPIYLYVQSCELAGSLITAFAHASDAVNVYNSRLWGQQGIETSGAVAAEVTAVGCRFQHENVISGGGAGQVLTLIDCYTWTGTATAPVDSADVSGTFTTQYIGHQPFQAVGGLWVDGNRTDDYTADGTITRPYKTIGAGVAALGVTKPTLYVLSGAYAPAASMVVPSGGGNWLEIIGIGDVQLAAGAAATPLFSFNPGAGVQYLRLRNLQITPDAAGTGILMENTGATAEHRLELHDCRFVSNAGSTALDVDHAVAGQINTVELRDCVLADPIAIAFANAGDTLRLHNCRSTASDGITSDAGAVAAEILLVGSEFLHEHAVAGGNAAQIVNAVGCMSRTGDTVNALDAADLIGTHTERITPLVQPATGIVYVDGGRTDPYVADGSSDRPYTTVATGLAALSATKPTLKIAAGTYTIAATLTVPDLGGEYCRIVGDGEVHLEGDAALNAALLDFDPNAAGVQVLVLQNLEITPDAAQVAVQMDNTGATGAHRLECWGCRFITNAGSTAVDIDHTVVGQLVRVDFHDCQLDDSIIADVANASDWIRLFGCQSTASAAVETSATDIAAEVLLDNCEVLHEQGVSGGHATQRVNANACYSRTGDVIAALDTNDLIGLHAETILNPPTLLAGSATDVTATAAQVNTLLRDPGKQAQGVVDFNATGTAAMTITIDGVVYQEADVEDFPNGVWTNGASAANSATSLAAAINGDTRGGGSPFTAVVSAAGDSVVLAADAVGVAGNVVVASSAGTATVENTTGGAAAALKRVYAVNRVVTAQDVLAVEVNIPVPFTPTAFVAQFLDTNGEVLEAITDRAAIAAAPARIRVVQAGATHLQATDVVSVVVFE